ncbi:MAG TPA: serine/threonine protein phosphatase, partial [Mycobacterium sp.]
MAEEVEGGLIGSLNHRRTALRLLTLLRPEFADWAALVLPDHRTGGLRLYGGNVLGFSDVIAHSSIAGTRL